MNWLRLSREGESGCAQKAPKDDLNNMDLLPVTKWYSDNIRSVKPGKIATIHSDELIGQVPKNQIISACFEIFQALVTESITIGDPAKITLIFPLITNANKISFRVPESIQALVKELSQEPPGFYLQSWEEPKRFTPYEEYRVPVRLVIPISNASCVSISYREYRYGIVLANNFEFGRSVDLEYFPEGVEALE